MALTGDLKDVVEMFRSRKWPDRGRDLDREAQDELLKLGFTCQFHYPRPYTNLHNRNVDGWINMVVQRSDGPIAIEVDHLEPRIYSVRKLWLFKGKRLIIVRRGKSFRPKQIRGIDLILSVAVEPNASNRDAADAATTDPLPPAEMGERPQPSEIVSSK